MTQKKAYFIRVTRVYPNGIEILQLTHLRERIIIVAGRRGYP